jgi:vancomycin resistance protein VanJ
MSTARDTAADASAPTDPAAVWLRRLDRLVQVLAVGYTLSLLATIAALRLIGEHWWVTSVALYLPRIGFALPLPVVALLVLWRLPRRWLIWPALALILLIFPIMGLRLPGAPSATAGAFRLRVLTFNIATGDFGLEKVIAEVRAVDPDIIMFQETRPEHDQRLREALPGYFYRVSTQFWLASRFPIEELVEPPHIPHRGKMRSPRFVHYLLRTPAGPLRVFNVHPISPRDALDEVHGDGLRYEILSGRLFRGVAANAVGANTDLRMAQLQSIAERAHAPGPPVLIAGDTNLPTLSWGLSHWMGDFRDGFSEAGSGFGYTFPATPHRPWMRIDRVLTDRRLRILSFRVIRSLASDHEAVTAEIELPASTGAADQVPGQAPTGAGALGAAGGDGNRAALGLNPVPGGGVQPHDEHAAGAGGQRGAPAGETLWE